MNDIVIVIVSILIGFSILEFIDIALTKKTRKSFQSVRSAERIREQFALVRQQLISLALKGEIDEDSYTFRMLYYITTFTLRRPDQYKEISESLSNIFFKDVETNENSELRNESESWSNSVKDLIMSTSKAFAILIEEYTPKAKLLKKLHVKLFIKLCENYEYFRNPQLVNIEKAQNYLYELSSA